MNTLPLLPHVRKIAIVRANGVGDFVFSLPALDALRHAYPPAELVLFGTRWHATFLEGRPGPVDRVIVIPECRLLNDTMDEQESEQNVDRFFATLNESEYDIAIQMHGGGGNSNPFTKRIGARLTVGMQAPGAPALDRTIRYTQCHNEVLRYLELVALVGARPRTLVPNLSVTYRDREEAAPWLRKFGEQPFAIVHPGATDPRRLWPAERFAEVADYLAERGLGVAVNVTERESELLEHITAVCRVPVVSLLGLSLRGLLSLIADASIVVSNDSGPLHLAVATDTPTVGIYQLGNAITGPPTTIDRHAMVLSWQTRCPVCDRDAVREGCDHTASFVSDVPTCEVIAAVEHVLERQSPVIRDRSTQPVRGTAFASG